MALSKLVFEGKNTKSFILWLKKFAIITKDLLLEINIYDNSFVAKTYVEDRTTVKRSEISFEEAELKYLGEPINKTIKCGFIDINKLMSALNIIGNSEFKITFVFTEILDNNDNKELVCTKLVINNNKTKFNIDCSSLKIFTYISDMFFRNNIMTESDLDEVECKFKLTAAELSEIKKLCNFDKDTKFVSFIKKDNKIFASEKSFDYKIEEEPTDVKSTDKFELKLYKLQLSKIEDEDYIVTLKTYKTIFNSLTSDTVVVLGTLAEDDDITYYEDNEVIDLPF